MKTNSLPAWATSMIQRRFGTVIAVNLQELRYGR
jgi:hypothetical protein